MSKHSVIEVDGDDCQAAAGLQKAAPRAQRPIEVVEEAERWAVCRVATKSMIFGYNTDVKHDDTVYHVQSEARVQNHMLQTQVFIKGQCVGKCATSYSEQTTAPDFSDEKMHELLREQHRRVLEGIKEGRLEEVAPPLHPAHPPTS